MTFRIALACIAFFLLQASCPVEGARRRGRPLPPQPQVVEDVPRPGEFDIHDGLINSVTGPEAVFQEGNRVHTSDYVRCIHHMSRVIDPIHRVFHNYGRVEGAASSDGTATNQSDSVPYVSPLPEWCRFRWIPRHQIFAGLDSIVFMGDSVLLRAFHDIFMVTDDIYFQKIVFIDDMLNGTITLRGGRIVKVFFIRNLFAATLSHTAAHILNPTNGFVTSRSLVVTTLGMHDTRWLIFRQRPPGYRKTQLGAWSYAKRYWNRHAGAALDGLSEHLRSFQSNADKGGLSFSAPFFVFRDPIPPSCSHPKYANRQPITRCPDLLGPSVIPWYRDTLVASGGLMGIPTVSMDASMPPCGLIDAGHMFRWCKEAELQMIIQAFRLGRRLGISQGRHIVSPNISGPLEHFFHNVSWVASVQAELTAPFAWCHQNTSMRTVGYARQQGLPHFSVRFDGPAPSLPDWLPSFPRSDDKITLDFDEYQVGSLSPIPSSSWGTMRAFARSIQEPTSMADEDAIAFFYHSFALNVFIHASLQSASKLDVVNSSDLGPSYPWGLASYLSQPSMLRWGRYYSRNMTIAGVAGMQFPDAVSELVGSMVRKPLRNESSRMSKSHEGEFATLEESHLVDGVDGYLPVVLFQQNVSKRTKAQVETGDTVLFLAGLFLFCSLVAGVFSILPVCRFRGLWWQ